MKSRPGAAMVSDKRVGATSSKDELMICWLVVPLRRSTTVGATTLSMAIVRHWQIRRSCRRGTAWRLEPPHGRAGCGRVVVPRSCGRQPLCTPVQCLDVRHFPRCEGGTSPRCERAPLPGVGGRCVFRVHTVCVVGGACAPPCFVVWA